MLIKRACSYCGKPLNEDLKYCTNCGNPIRLSKEEIMEKRRKAFIEFPEDPNTETIHIEEITLDAKDIPESDGLTIGLTSEHKLAEVPAAQEENTAVKKESKVKKPKRSVRKKEKPEKVKKEKTKRKSDIYNDEDEEYYSSFKVRKWPLVLLGILAAATVLVVAFGCLYLFRPDILDAGFNKLSYVTGKEYPKFDVGEAPVATPTPEPEETPEPTPTPEATKEPEETPEVTADPSLGTVKIITTDMNIRQDGSLSGTIVGVAPSGGTYDYFETKTNDGYTWYRIGDNQWIADTGTWLQVIPKN